ALVTYKWTGTMRTLLLMVAFAFAYLITPSASTLPVVAVGDASIAHDVDAGTWSLSAGATTLVLALDRARDFRVLGLVTPSNRSWTVGAPSDSEITVNGIPMVFGARASGFVYHDVTAKVVVPDAALQLDVVFDLPSADLRMTRHYGIASGSPTFEV